MPSGDSIGADASWAAHGLHTHESLFGTAAELILPAPRNPDATRTGPDVAAALSAVHAGWHELHRRGNAWKPGAELGQINQRLARGEAVRVSPLLAGLIRLAAQAEQASAGWYAPASGRLVAAWGFHADRSDEDGNPAFARASADPAFVRRWAKHPPCLAQLHWQGHWLRSGHPLLGIDLAGIAKGWASDRALEELRRHGLGAGLADLGGNLAAMGPGPQGSWRIGLRRATAASTGTPRSVLPPDVGGAALSPTGQLRTVDAADLLAVLPLDLAPGCCEAVVSSGQYERGHWLAGGVAPDGSPSSGWVGHVIDPLRGRPAQGLAGVTVVHPQAASADVAATALLAAGPSRWQDLARRMALDQVLVQHADGGVEVTARLAARLQWQAGDAARGHRVV